MGCSSARRASVSVWAPRLHGGGEGHLQRLAGSLHDFDGYCYSYVEGAKVGDEYQYEITNGEFKADRNDPYAPR